MCTCGHPQVAHWDSGGPCMDCAGTYIQCYEFELAEQTDVSELIRDDTIAAVMREADLAITYKRWMPGDGVVEAEQAPPPALDERAGRDLLPRDRARLHR